MHGDRDRLERSLLFSRCTLSLRRKHGGQIHLFYHPVGRAVSAAVGLGMANRGEILGAPAADGRLQLPERKRYLPLRRQLTGQGQGRLQLFPAIEAGLRRADKCAAEGLQGQVRGKGLQMHPAVYRPQRLHRRKVVPPGRGQLLAEPSGNCAGIGGQVPAAQAGLVEELKEILYLQVGIRPAVFQDVRRCHIH